MNSKSIGNEFELIVLKLVDKILNEEYKCKIFSTLDTKGSCGNRVVLLPQYKKCVREIDPEEDAKPKIANPDIIVELQKGPNTEEIKVIIEVKANKNSTI
jgi:hypothetical protein